MRRWLLVGGATLTTALFAAPGCGDDTVELPQGRGPEVRFELGSGVPTFLDVPFPSDAYLAGDGTLVDDIPGLEAYVPNAHETIEAALGQLPGFGLNAGVMFRIDREGDDDPATHEPRAAAIDEASLPVEPADCQSADAAILLVDLDAPDSDAMLPCRAAYIDDRPNGSPTRPSLVVLPARGTVFGEGHRIVAIVTSGVTADGGEALGASPTFVDVRDGQRRKTPLERLYGDAVDDVLEKVPGLDKDRIVAVTPFTTQAWTQELFDLRSEISDMEIPTLLWDEESVAPMYPAVFTKEQETISTATLTEWLGNPRGLDDGSDDPAGDSDVGLAHDALLAVATGVFEAPSFLRERPNGYEDPEHRTFARDGDGKPTIDPDNPTSKIWITIAIPDAPMPASGYPVVVLQHGLQGDRSFLLTMANTFAKEGYATVAIEALTFGARSASDDFTVDDISRFPWSDNEGKYAGPDGLVDENATAIALFGDLVNFSASRDQFRQSVLDFGTLAELLADPNLDLGPLDTLSPGVKLDGSRLAYVSDSFGSVLGGLVSAVDPRYRAMVLNVGGGGILTEMVSNGPLLATAIGTLGGLTFGLTHDRLDWRHPLVNLLQPILDAADPLSYAGSFVRDPVTVTSTEKPKSVVIIEVLWDELVANEGTEALAKAAGIPLAVPNAGPNGNVKLEEVEPENGVISGVPSNDHTVVIVQSSPATHGSNLYNAHGTRTYAPPFVRDETGAFPLLEEPVTIDQPYLGLQAMAVGFIGSAFDGDVPVVADFPTPIRDFDDDGTIDDDDADPLDPSTE